MADKAKDIMEAAGDAVQEAKEVVKDTEERAENASSKEEDKAEESKEAKAEEESEGKEGDSETEEDAESDEKKKEGSKLFKKKKDKKDEKIEELNDKYTRLFAEFDNFRKRSEKEKKAMFEVGAKSVIEKILPIIDSFERGLATIPEEEKTGFAEGMDKVYKQLITSLEEAGVKQIEAVGQEFDPNLHNAVMHIEDESLGENIIAEELQKGYIYRETVVRHSMVKVAN
jgi:Molecular chaperone GrpE (heat shock protein)